MNNEYAAEQKKNDTFFIKMKKLYLKSIKPVQTDEPVVAFFFRPVGFLIALLSSGLKLTPNMLTVVRALLGITAGICFIPGTAAATAAGAIILFAATFFDVADGQLARIQEKFSRMGTIIDGIGDGLTVGAVYMASAWALYSRDPASGMYWWVMCLLAVISFLIQLNSYGFLRHEYIYYVIENSTEKRDTFEEINREIKNIDTKGEKTKKNKILLTILMIFNIGLIESASRILLHKKYKGYNSWYRKAGSVPDTQKEKFRTDYKKNNGWLLQLFGNLGMGSNLLVFTVAGLFNRLDLGIYTILIIFNLYYLLLVIIQQISFRVQLKKAAAI